MTRGRISLYLDLETYEEMARMLRIRSALVNQMMLVGISHSDLEIGKRSWPHLGK